MKRLFLVAFGLAVMLSGASGAMAQGAARREPDPAVLRDPLMEKDSKHNLEAARQYFKLKKAYRASLSRAEEIIAGYPNFSLIDEALYIAGMSNLYLSQSKGKQPPTLSAEKHRDEARMYLSRVVNEYPESSFRKDAEKGLESLGGALQKTESKP
ncbi:MAG TPA: outer membrane protein assembly factor BamD [Pyrinomonadaceae bacterium]|nr:outer membrane protein assembly factor BamD [Pyrinomonadaceae bacterium]